MAKYSSKLKTKKVINMLFLQSTVNHDQSLLLFYNQST